MIRCFIVLFFLFPFFIQSEDCPEELQIVAPFMPETSLATTKCAKEKKKASSAKKKKTPNAKTAEKEQKITSTENYNPPSLSESLNDSNSLKNEIKRELSAEDPPIQPANLENPTEEVADFGDLSISISERKKEESLVKKRQKN